MDIIQNKKAHFIGICGAGMSAVAKLLVDCGWQVSGSDDNFYPPVSEYIKKHEVNFKKGYKSDNIPLDANLIVIGKNADLTMEKNEEVRTAFSLDIPVKSFPEVLKDLSRRNKNIVVAGSYGKSTCTALIAWCLRCAGKDPSYFIGAIPNTPTESSQKGGGQVFVLEGDEYPSSNWDSSSKFMHYHPSHLLLTSLSHDHFDIFKTHQEYIARFTELLSLIPKYGLIAACADGDAVTETISKLKLKGRTVFYSIKTNASWRIKNLTLSETSSFDIYNNSMPIVNVNTQLLGIHNIENILGVGALLLSLKLVKPSQFAEAIASFKAINRRLDKKSDKTSIPVYEGFGSSYQKARASIEAIRAHFPDKKLVVLFEPRSFNWRSREALSWYDDVFSGVSHVLIFSPPSVSGNQLTLEDIVSRVREAGLSVEGFKSMQEGTKLLEIKVNKKSAVLILSSGGFGGFIDLATKWLEQNYKK